MSSSKKNSFTCGKAAFAHRNFVDDVSDAAHAIAMTADRLRPEAEGAARFAAAACIERDVWVLEIAAEIFLDVEIALIDRRHERQRVHVFEDLAIGVVDDDAVGDCDRRGLRSCPVASVGDLLDGEVELVAGDEVDGASTP